MTQQKYLSRPKTRKLKRVKRTKITLDEYTNPEINKSELGLNYFENIPTKLNKYLNETARLNTILSEYEAGTRTIILEGVNIQSTKQYVKEEDPFYRAGNIMGTPDVRLIPDSLNVVSGNIFNSLLNRIAGVSVTNEFANPQVVIRGNRAAPLFLLDNVPTDVDILLSIPMNQIAFVDVLKNPSPIYGGRGSGGVIAVFMKNGKNYSGKSYERPYFVNIEHPGYHKIKEFYSPDYSVEKPTHKRPDVRTTLYWNPNVSVDSTGVAQVLFYTGDVETNYHVEIEGLSANGDPIIINKSFSTKE
jgi:hypothetical protein